jgi:hypothetical protein
MDEIVDILEPPFFEVSGETKPREQAFADGDWIGTFNLWILSKASEPSILYQQRSLNKSWAPVCWMLQPEGITRPEKS